MQVAKKGVAQVVDNLPELGEPDGCGIDGRTTMALSEKLEIERKWHGEEECEGTGFTGERGRPYLRRGAMGWTPRGHPRPWTGHTPPQRS